MSATMLLNDLQHLGVHVIANGDKLKVNAPKGVLTLEMRRRIAEQKAELLALLQFTQEVLIPLRLKKRKSDHFSDQPSLLNHILDLSRCGTFRSSEQHTAQSHHAKGKREFMASMEEPHWCRT
jgi:tubulysin polyketide synthase-like protein